MEGVDAENGESKIRRTPSPFSSRSRRLAFISWLSDSREGRKRGAAGRKMCLRGCLPQKVEASQRKNESAPSKGRILFCHRYHFLTSYAIKL